jgi:cytoskeletal protein CcmA (bactofilin family)
MNVLARAINGSDDVVAGPIGEPEGASSRPQAQHTPLSSRPHAGPSLIGAALSVVGRLESAGDIQVDGTVEGEIRGQAVRIGSGAVIKGTVFAEIVELSGTIEGKIDARSAFLAKTARMSGDIVYQSLQIDQGARFNGNSRPRSGSNP